MDLELSATARLYHWMQSGPLGCTLRPSLAVIITLVLFDIDGTLIRSGGSGRWAMSAAAGELFGCPEMFEGLSFAGAVDSGIVAHAMAAAGIDPTPRQMGLMRARYLRRLSRRLREKPGSVCPGVEDMIAALSGRAQIGLLTGNWERGARIKLAAHGLGSVFSGCVGAYGSDASERNALIPHAHRRARRRWDGLARIVVVGDTPADIRCARAGADLLGPAGPEIIAVGVETGFASAEDLSAAGPDLQVKDLVSGHAALMDLI